MQANKANIESFVETSTALLFNIKQPCPVNQQVARQRMVQFLCEFPQVFEFMHGFTQRFEELFPGKGVSVCAHNLRYYFGQETSEESDYGKIFIQGWTRTYHEDYRTSPEGASFDEWIATHKANLPANFFGTVVCY